MTCWGVTLHQVTAHWGGRKILENLSFKLEFSTNCFPLMGPSGQGKSTLLYLLATLKWPTQGTLMWTFPDGKTFRWGARGLKSSEATLLRRHYFGFAFQASTLSPYLTVVENLAYPLLLQGVSWKMAIQQAEATLLEVLLPSEKTDTSLLHRFPSQLSGGQRQRVALAQAIIHEPYILFADEPTGQLDLHTRKQVMGVLKGWVEKGPRGLIWVTHHHLDDLDLMGIDQLIFVENQSCMQQNREDLKRWLSAPLITADSAEVQLALLRDASIP